MPEMVDSEKGLQQIKMEIENIRKTFHTQLEHERELQYREMMSIEENDTQQLQKELALHQAPKLSKGKMQVSVRHHENLEVISVEPSYKYMSQHSST